LALNITSWPPILRLWQFYLSWVHIPECESELQAGNINQQVESLPLFVSAKHLYCVAMLVDHLLILWLAFLFHLLEGGGVMWLF
jgi:hypothetical protein